MTTREEAIEACDILASNWPSIITVDHLEYSEKARKMVQDGMWSLFLECTSYYTPVERYAEVAQLLREGWLPGQKLARR